MSRNLIKPGETRTAARVADDEFEARLAALREEAGLGNARIVRFICARASERFHAVFERESARHRFRLARIVKDEPAPVRGFFSRVVALWSGAPQIEEEEALDIRLFDTAGILCPWCGTAGGFVCCGVCGCNVCRAHVRKLPDGRESFACTAECGAIGVLVTLEKLKVQEADGTALDDRKALAAPEGKERLSAPAPLLIGKPKK